MTEDEELQKITERREELAGEAEAIAHEFWAKHHERRAQKDHGQLGIRIERRGTGISIRWFRAVFWKPDNGDKTRVNYRYLTKGRQNIEYPPSGFEWCKRWEYALATDMEKRLGEIRRELDKLQRRSRSIKRSRWNRERAKARRTEETAQ